MSEIYYTTSNNLRETLDKYGIAIIPSILNENECSAMQNGMWDYLEHISSEWAKPINRHLPETYINIYSLFIRRLVVTMIIKFWSVGHCQMAWDVRQNEKIVQVFADFWNVDPDELLASFDSSSIHMPPEITGKWTDQNRWHHTDQSYTNNDLTCLQSWVTAFDVNNGDATLAVLEGSHKYHKEFGQKYEIDDPNNWYRLDDDDKLLFYTERGCTEKLITCPKGSLVIWDSRTIHCGIEPSKSRAKPNFRCVTYLCYLPRYLASEEELKEKQDAFNNLMTTTHYPYNINTIPKTPYEDMDENDFITPIDKPKLTELGYRLAGF